MKNYLLIIILSLAYPVFASCIINDNGTACIADLDKIKTLNPQLENPKEDIFPENFLKSDTKRDSINDADLEKQKRDFGTQNNDYGYNPSCQFGVCTNSSTPKTFDSSQQ